MSSSYPHYRTAEEKLIGYGIMLTWPSYMVGGLYVLGSVIGWLLLAMVLLRLFIEGPKAHRHLPFIVTLWVAGMLMMEVSLLVAHTEWSLGLGKTIKSSIGWAKGWALLAIFPLCGAILKFRLTIITRSLCVVAGQAILFMFITVMLYAVGGPDSLFVSPLSAIGGPGPEYFEVRLFGINPESGLPRWFFFAPWAPAAGLVSCLMLPIVCAEPDLRWRIIGIAGCATMCVLSQSRAGLAIFIMILPASYFLNRSLKPWVLILAGTTLPLLLLLGQPLIEGIMDLYQQAKESRPGSTRVRGSLAQMALQRWETEAPIWGHGIVERGPKIVEHMPIGSHHSWYGLLYVKGIVGVIALTIPMGCSLLALWWKAQFSRRAGIGFSLLLILLLYSFFENLEILAYLYWPALLWIGAALNVSNPKPCSSPHSVPRSAHCKTQASDAFAM